MAVVSHIYFPGHFLLSPTVSPPSQEFGDNHEHQEDIDQVKPIAVPHNHHPINAPNLKHNVPKLNFCSFNPHSHRPTPSLPPPPFPQFSFVDGRSKPASGIDLENTEEQAHTTEYQEHPVPKLFLLPQTQLHNDGLNGLLHAAAPVCPMMEMVVVHVLPLRNRFQQPFR
ncbi:hypothetical protein PIB30_026754 [Stylosanthes scabra]|uniref:Uncharacterized protein n=1 Tax=Stylosanthes scabra TaxID=79078 RepID=A0ABU6WBE6_9FABA|nr:hypothetical protein [Stylosanthes scabra]